VGPTSGVLEVDGQHQLRVELVPQSLEALRIVAIRIVHYSGCCANFDLVRIGLSHRPTKLLLYVESYHSHAFVSAENTPIEGRHFAETLASGRSHS
jgi:hypothetical protein